MLAAFLRRFDVIDLPPRLRQPHTMIIRRYFHVFLSRRSSLASHIFFSLFFLSRLVSPAPVLFSSPPYFFFFAFLFAFISPRHVATLPLLSLFRLFIFITLAIFILFIMLTRTSFSHFSHISFSH